MAASNAQVTFAFLAKDAASSTIRGLSKTLGGLKSAASSVGGFIKNNFTKALLGVGAVIAGAGAALVKFTKDAIEGEAAEAKFVSVLKARGLASKENLAATEALVKSGQRLAFTGDDVRGSLATATQFTKNFTKAQKISAVAQDLARAKGISLEAATKVVGKAFSGNGKALKTFGIELGKNAKGQKVLDAVTKKFGGTAEAYATTTAGAMEAVGIAVQQAGEGAVKPFLPIINELVGIFYSHALPAIEAVSKGIAGFIEENKALISTVIQTVAQIAANLLPVFVKVGEFIFGTIIPAIVGFVEKLTAPGGVTDSVGKVVGGIMKDLVPAFGKFFDGVGKLVGKVFELVGVLWGDGTGPLAIAVQAIGGAFSIVLSILGNIGGAIATAIDFVISLGKAIMDSPIGFLIKAIAGVVGGAAGAIGGAFGLGGGGRGVVPASVTSGGGRDSVGGRDIRNEISVNLDGKKVAESVSTRLNLTPGATPRGSY